MIPVKKKGYKFMEAGPEFKKPLEGKAIEKVEIAISYQKWCGQERGYIEFPVEGGFTFFLDDGTYVVLGYTELGEWLEYVGKNEE